MTALLLTGVAFVTATAGPIASIRVVDPFWQPLPGATVEFVPVRDCVAAKPSAVADSGFTNDQGSAEFVIGDGPSYVIRASHSGGFESQELCVSFGALSDVTRTHVQLRLRLDPANVINLSEPARRTTGRDNATPNRLVLLDFVGVYRDAQGRYYEVGYIGGGQGLDLSLPDGRTLFFSRRDGTKFMGPAGTLTFRTERNRVVSLSLGPTHVDADRFRNTP